MRIQAVLVVRKAHRFEICCSAAILSQTDTVLAIYDQLDWYPLARRRKREADVA